MMNEREQLTERKKELNCIYRIDKLVEENLDIHSFLMATCGVIADGFQYPCYVSVLIELDDLIIRSSYFREGRNYLSETLFIENKTNGIVKVYYSDKLEQKNPFLEEEKHLLKAVSKRISDYLLIENYKNQPQTVDRKNQYVEIRQKILNDAINSANFENLGLISVYVIGSVKEHTSGIASDIDLILYYDGKETSIEKTNIWFESWSKSVLTSGLHKDYISDMKNLFDLHFISDEDIKNKTSYAVMINSLENRAKLIKTRT